MTDRKPTDRRQHPEPILEIVRVRCVEGTVRGAEASLRELLATPGSHVGHLVRSATTPHDLGLHLRAEADPSAPIGASALGLRVAEALRAFGPVSHSVWIEIATNPPASEDPR
ncbi:MAG: hypothetical protein AAGE94_00685 [Acidobacteriota bacterium]